MDAVVQDALEVIGVIALLPALLLVAVSIAVGGDIELLTAAIEQAAVPWWASLSPPIIVLLIGIAALAGAEDRL